MSCESCKSKDTCQSKGTGCSEESLKLISRYGNIKNVIGIISGKGGVGKSTVTGMMASMLSKKGYKVGVLDADITGPSMPRFFGVNNKRAKIIPLENDMVKFEPVETESGIKIISMNLLTAVEDEPVIWRGPVITGVLKQMFVETNWEELDYLLIDMPPGTGDIALTVMQEFPIDEIVIVSTPQDMVSMIVKKVVIMAQKIGVKIKGVVENMAYINCPDCDKKIRVFSRKSSEENAEYLGIPLIGELPINIELTEALEQGKAEEYVKENPLYSLIFEGLY
ncbi:MULTISPECIES: Mrp/NBP35 family ATP-binding protein [Clostridium]|jgi:ATPases involved in chromosome partitioning|uniref:Iron-sulfur cluster carrier protein n=2 Tax=Clostridium beijerinckii TaxID=1520 RepID=A0AAE2RMD9_CLOBE|nr:MULTISPECIES: Mrp/NBP35 family ATP-binding protein [Clostridium]ABR32254.1 Mrp/NBP35 ATP-binding family protein [Clostridium beijerinckii NCIMB 8052]AIU01063.1 Mrp/NBP35 ATP-binding family protein [Clostridium beijerinckii ATCC 35702]MBF7808070.1 Mrp/NBP35 family ATP-binding protein [Clostridium beijerinckii]NRT21633.1 Mrp family chromosome partitioning ATPase [Clostridium beijerinckii]NRT65865.1 Mrp family chromosome partitioning ATPase [Clostridium beijerinckii]